jgi:hypothetical protein
MYCANCGTQLTAGLSYCNRCGFNLRERTESNTAVTSAFLTAITTLGVAGLAILFGGALVLKKKAQLDPDLIAAFMAFTFLLVGVIEFMLIRNLSKLMTPKEKETRSLPTPVTNNLRLPQHSTLGEPIPSVTENTTRTLEYSEREQRRN